MQIQENGRQYQSISHWGLIEIPPKNPIENLKADVRLCFSMHYEDSDFHTAYRHWRDDKIVLQSVTARLCRFLKGE